MAPRAPEPGHIISDVTTDSPQARLPFQPWATGSESCLAALPVTFPVSSAPDPALPAAEHRSAEHLLARRPRGRAAGQAVFAAGMISVTVVPAPGSEAIRTRPIDWRAKP